MPRETKGQRLAKLFDHARIDAREQADALRLQAIAWRQVALIATADPARGAKLAQWLLFHSVPYVDGDAVKKLIVETEKDAGDCGTKSGVFTPAEQRTAPSAE